MISPELARQIRLLQIHSKKAVNDVLAGEYKSVFKGRGMEFDEIREYQPGDDIRTIDWNVTARTGDPFVKRYVEEREQTVLLAVDLSASGAFASVERTKNEKAAEFCALIAFSAIRNKDRVGLIVFTDQVEMFIPPARGASHVLRLIRELLHFTPSHTGTDFTVALDYLGRVQRRRAVVFLVSDFIADGYTRRLRTLARKHDVIAVQVTDPREENLPDVGLLELNDAETGALILVDTSSRSVRQRYQELAGLRRSDLRGSLAAMGIDQISLTTDGDSVGPLVRFFRQREQRLR